MKKSSIAIGLLALLALLGLGGAGWLWIERGSIINASATTQAESETLKDQITAADGVQDKNRQLQDQLDDLQAELEEAGQATAPPSQPPAATPEIPADAPTATPADPGAPTATPGGPGGIEPPAEVIEVMRRIEGEVIELRGLPEERPVTRRFLTRDELRAYIEGEMAKENTPDDYRHSAAELWLLGLAPKDIDLEKLYVDLQTEQISGFYDPETDTFYLVGEDTTLPPVDQITYAHEFNHNLQDQAVDLNAGLEKNEFDSDRATAFRSLIEGDATLLMTQWVQEKLVENLPPDELLKLSQDLQNQANGATVLDSAPTIVREGLMFPYAEGQAFVQALYDAGGWPAVTAALSDPPTSTEQILHPEKYSGPGRDEPNLPERFDLTGALGGGWTTATTNTLGEFDLQVMLRDMGLPAAEAAAAAAGIGGVRYALYEDANQAPLLQLTTRWDTAADGDEFLEAVLSKLIVAGDLFQRGDVLVAIKGGGQEYTILFGQDEAALRTAMAALP